MFRSCAMPLLLAIILARANAYSQALVMLRLSSTVLHQNSKQFLLL